MAGFTDNNVRGFKVDAAIGQYLRVKLDSTQNQVTVAGLADDDIGTTETETFAAGEHVAVRLRNAAGTRKMVASEAVAIGALLYSAAAGKVSDTAASTSHYVGKALQAASGDGSIIEVLTDDERDAQP